MSLPDYYETLGRFGLDELKTRVDLQLTASGDIAVTRDGDLQMGNTRVNALFRLVERWRQSDSTINELFRPMLRAARQLDELQMARANDEGPSLRLNPKAYHEVTGSILECQSVSATLAGAVFVVLNNLLQRFRLDLGASDDDWSAAGTMINTYSVGEIIASAAANFRHCDEWASSKTPTRTQRRSMDVLCGLLKVPR